MSSHVPLVIARIESARIPASQLAPLYPGVMRSFLSLGPRASLSFYLASFHFRSPRGKRSPFHTRSDKLLARPSMCYYKGQMLQFHLPESRTQLPLLFKHHPEEQGDIIMFIICSTVDTIEMNIIFLFPFCKLS